MNNNHIDEHNNNNINNNMGGSSVRSNNRDMQQKQQQQNNNIESALRCPRCDSSNTKFCYYNNYSLSQPRYFCKGCKRYWTKGGTLRSVPVGGGCRKNRRLIKRSSSSSSSSFTTSNNAATTNNNNLDVSSPNPPLFYGYQQPINNNNNPSFLGYELQNPSQINGVELGFSPSSCGFAYNMINNGGGDINYGFTPNSNPSLMMSNYNPYTNNNSSSCSTTTTTGTSPAIISSFLSPHTILPSYDVKLEGQIRKMGYHGSIQTQNEIIDHHQTMMNSSSSDPSVLWGGLGGNNNNSNLGGVWLDSTNNIGPSVPSLI